MRKIILFLIILSCLLKNNLPAQYWSAVGEGIPGGIYAVGVIHSTAVYNGELYVGGVFDTAGGIPIKNIAKWNGTNWSPVGSGIDSYNSYDGVILSLEVYNGELYAGGRFDTAGGIEANNIAKWNGINWSPVGTGIISTSMDQPVHSLTVHNGMLYAAGHFDTAGGIAANNIAKWDGVAWSSLGTGINGRVSALVSYNGSLYAGGNFTAAGGIAARCIAKWDGVNWSQLGTGINDYGVFCLAVYNNALYAGGWFTQAGGVAARSLAKWNGVNWSSIGNIVGVAVLSLFSRNDTLYVGGSLNPQNECIAKWDGINWTFMGNGIGNGPGDYNGASVWSIGEYNGDLYAGGGFQTAGHVQVNNIAKWTNQCSMAPLQPGNINGNTTACQNSQVTYSIGAVNDVADFTWTLPPGWSGSSISNTITATVGTDGGIISAVANNPCGSSSAQTLMVTVVTPLSQPGIISGSDNVCENSVQTYSISPVSGAASYIWTLPPWWTGYSITNSINATPIEESGIISVVAVNNYCMSDPQTLFVTVKYSIPRQPDAINGSGFVCHGSIQTYSINPVDGATSYTWTLPPGWTGSSTTNSITTTAGTNGGTISVYANNSCGSSIERTLTVAMDTVLSNPAEIKGNIFVSVNQKDTYSNSLVNGAAAYNWTLSGGGDIVAGQNTNSITISWHTSGTYILTVNANNSCGPGGDQRLVIKVAAVDEEDPFSLRLFPNPSAGEIFLKAKRVQDKIIRVDVVNMMGQVVYRSGLMTGANDYTQSINLEKMPQGVYVVKVSVDDKVYVRRLVKNK